MRSAAKVRWVAVLVLSALSLGAQQDAATFSIAGAVVNSVSGDPVPYALVQLEGRLSRATLADLNGQFQFDQVTAGRLIVTARKPGFFNDEQLQRRRSNLVTIDANTSPLAIKLTPEAVVSGHIEDEDGNPVERTRVVLVTTVIENGRRRYRREEAALSDADGNYRIPGVRPGSYVLSAGESNRRDPRLQGDSTSGYPLEVFYPGVTDFASAARLRLVAGQQFSADFTLKRVPVFHISGVISGAAPGRPAGVTLRTTSVTEMPRGAPMDSSSGRFTIRGIPAGHYILTARSMSDRDPLLAEVPLDVTSNLDDLHVALIPALSIPVAIRSELTTQVASGETPDQGRAGRLNIGDPAPRSLAAVELWPIDPDPTRSAAFMTYETGPGGERRLAVHDAHPGLYQTEIRPTGPYYVAAATCGPIDLLREPLPVTATTPTDPIEIVLRNDGGTVQGNVRLNEGDGTVTVLLFRAGAPMARPQMSGFSDTGRFFFDNVAPGDYTLIAVEGVDDIEYANRDAIAPLLARGTHLTVNPGASATVSLDLMRRNQ